MTTKKAIKMIDNYLLELKYIDKDWVEVLNLCKKFLLKNNSSTISKANVMNNDWKDFNVEKPSEIGLYVVKVDSHPFNYDGVCHNVMKWDGIDFILPIGRPITDEVLYWKKI